MNTVVMIYHDWLNFAVRFQEIFLLAVVDKRLNKFAGLVFQKRETN